MPNCEIASTKECNLASKQVGGYKEVVIIGNGPSGICLSYFLSGHWPYWNKTKVSDEYLQMRMEYADDGTSIVEKDLEFLCNGLEGRSRNPVALLYDKLKHPDGDLGTDSPTCLHWTYDPLKEIDHICIGKASGAGGAWNDLDGSQLTISLARWMELPDMSYLDWKRQSRASNLNAGLVFSSKNSNFSEDNSLLNGNCLRKSVGTNKTNYFKQTSIEDSRASMNDVRNYYRDYVKQKNLDKYLLNNATVTSVKRICCPKLICPSEKTNSGASSSVNTIANLWEVTGIIDKRDRKKASSLTHKGDLMEFRFFCKHLVLANGANDLHNELKVKGETSRFILRSIRDLEEKIKEDLTRLQKDPLLIVGSGLSAADAILLAQKYHIRIIHVIRRNVNDPELIFNKLPKKIYPEYQRVYEQMIHNKYTFYNNNTKCLNENKIEDATINSATPSLAPQLNKLKTLSSNDINILVNDSSSHNNSVVEQNQFIEKPNYILYDEHQVKYFTSKRTCVLVHQSNHQQKIGKSSTNANVNRQLHLHKQYHQHHQRQLNELDEQNEIMFMSNNFEKVFNSCAKLDEIELKISYACILIGFSPDLDFLPPNIVNNLAVNPAKLLDTKDNPISINSYTHESTRFKNLYAMGPLISDNFVRFATGGALAISAAIWKQHSKNENNPECEIKQSNQDKLQI